MAPPIWWRRLLDSPESSGAAGRGKAALVWQKTYQPPKTFARRAGSLGELRDRANKPLWDHELRGIVFGGPFPWLSACKGAPKFTAKSGSRSRSSRLVTPPPLPGSCVATVAAAAAASGKPIWPASAASPAGRAPKRRQTHIGRPCVPEFGFSAQLSSARLRSALSARDIQPAELWRRPASRLARKTPAEFKCKPSKCTRRGP